jgi:hypothetical protein
MRPNALSELDQLLTAQDATSLIRSPVYRSTNANTKSSNPLCVRVRFVP